MYGSGIDKEVKRKDKVESCGLLYQTRRDSNYSEVSTKASQGGQRRIEALLY